MSEVLVRRLFLASVGFLSCTALFGYGLAVERYQVWPYAVINEAVRVAKSYAEFGETIPEGRRVPAPAGASREAFTVTDPTRLNNGFYLFSGWDDTNQTYGAWLYDHTGARLHTWRLDYYALDPDGPWNGENHPHPVNVQPDGSIIAAFDFGDIVARVDACSEPVWVKHGIYHHSLTEADDGSFWTWRGDGTPFGHYHYAENFDPETGETITEVALVENIIKHAGPLSAIFGVRPDFEFKRWDRNPVFLAANDLFHPNDVESLSTAMAPAFPMFEPGDLLLSFRNINLVTVVDPDTYIVKWWSRGAWIRQHDPDFTADGKISVFNNNSGRGRSEIIKIDPNTNEITNEITNELFHGDASFFTDTMGKHQYLPNGNILLVVPDEGRALEVTPDGNAVMEFNNLAPNSPAHNDHVQDAMWVPLDYFDSIPICANAARPTAP